MLRSNSPTSKLSDTPVDIKLKLATLWASTTLCYLYCDYLALYSPGKLQRMLQGQMGPLGSVTPQVLLGTSILMAIPCSMVALSLLAPAWLSRWANVGAGVLFTAIMILVVPGCWAYYQFFGGLEILFTVAIVVLALRWPKVAVPGARG